mgnify:CR=1 FL=1
MIDLTPEQTKQLTIWAYDRLWDMMEHGSYQGDNWFTVDESIPSLCGKIDINIWDDGEEGSIVKAAAYVIDTLEDGSPNTNTSNWTLLFGDNK